MIPGIETINEKKLVGKRLSMSFTDYRVAELWQSFMPHLKEINNMLSTKLISMAVYSPRHFTDFSPDNLFEKWAAVEVADFDNVPEGMETCIVSAGAYAVLKYKGLSSDNSVFQYIHNSWLPASDYILDNRPHLEILGEKYKNNDPNSEEELWIPVKPK